MAKSSTTASVIRTPRGRPHALPRRDAEADCRRPPTLQSAGNHDDALHDHLSGLKLSGARSGRVLPAWRSAAGHRPPDLQMAASSGSCRALVSTSPCVWRPSCYRAKHVLLMSTYGASSRPSNILDCSTRRRSLLRPKSEARQVSAAVEVHGCCPSCTHLSFAPPTRLTRPPSGRRTALWPRGANSSRSSGERASARTSMLAMGPSSPPRGPSLILWWMLEMVAR